jgi:hypothetical protein
MLSNLGRREAALAAAEEAVALYRRLATDRPDAFIPDLATSLNTLALHPGTTPGGSERPLGAG